MFKRFIKRNNEEDYERVIFEMFYERVYSIAYYVVKDRHLAQDVVQETFLKAFLHMESIKEAKKFGAWLGSIATRTAIDFLRKANRLNDLPQEDLDIRMNLEPKISPVEQKVESRFLKELVNRNISLLEPPEYREIIILKYELDMKDQEIADVLGISVSAAKSRLHRAKAKLRKNFQQQKDVIGGDIG